jgi:hypothetical protein
MATNRNTDPDKYFAFAKFCLNFLKLKTVVPKLNKKMIKADMNGAAARMQGYAARLGFGMTRIKNQMVEASPISINKYIELFRFLRSC